MGMRAVKYVNDDNIRKSLKGGVIAGVMNRYAEWKVEEEVCIFDAKSRPTAMLSVNGADGKIVYFETKDGLFRDEYTHYVGVRVIHYKTPPHRVCTVSVPATVMRNWGIIPESESEKIRAFFADDVTGV
jgi:hypothetical protein